MPTPIDINVAINTASSAKSIGELRTGLRSLISLQDQVGAGSANFTRLRDAINETEGRMGDLTDSFQTLRGSGVERVNASLSLFQQGLQNADPEQLTIGLQGLKAAMASIPILLLVEGFKLLFENFDKLVALFSTSAQNIKANEEALKNLTNQVDFNRIAIERQIIAKDSELKQLNREEAGLGAVIKKMREINDLKQDQFQGELKKTDKEINNVISQMKDLNEEGLHLSDFLPEIFGGDAVKVQADALREQLAKLQKTRGDLDNDRIKSTTETEDNIKDIVANARKQELEFIKQAAEQGIRIDEGRTAKQREEQFKRIKQIQGFTAEAAALEYEYLDNSIRADAEAAQKESDIQTKKAQDIIDGDKLFNQLIQQQDATDAAARQAKAEANALLAYNFSVKFNQRTYQGKLDAIDQEKKLALIRVEGTADEEKARQEIIQESEEKIFQLRVKKAQEYVNYAQQTAAILNTIGQLETNNENYELNQQKYAKDAAIENDNNRTEEQIQAEKDSSDAILSNDNLTSQQRQQISQNSEKRQQQIAATSKNNQLAINKKFADEEIKIRKQQFERQKALQIVTGIINTAAAVLQTIATVPYPANIPLAILAGVAGAAQVAVIASQKFDDGGAGAQAGVIPVVSGSGGSGSTGTLAGGGSPQQLSQNALSPNIPAPQTEIEKARQQRIYVLENDIRTATNKVDLIETRATFGD